MNERGKQISLSVDSELVNIEHIYVVNCDTGLTLCVTKTVFDQREQLLSLILLETVEAVSFVEFSMLATFFGGKGTNLRVDVVKFSSVDNMKVTYVQATLDLCVMFTPTTRMRSNSAIKFVATDGLTCFERTVPLAVQQIAFVGFENAETLIYNTTTLNGTYIPDIEIVFSINKNFKREKHEWIYRESCKVMTLMTTWTRFPYPLKELKFISAPIRAPSHSSLGLITLQDRLVDHPSYTLAHVSLIHSVIQQWLPGLVGSTKSNESCFMESLSVYLEWKVDEVLHIVNKTRGTEVELIRPQDLSSEEKDSLRPVRVVEARKRFFHSPW
uniref:DUF1758 domain-containing protein n=1 Tax=Angiostrongylus cantonensis TaxID=6313 RepID=A0A0K0CXB4_ANGCA